MKNSIFTLLILLLIVNISNAQWEQTGSDLNGSYWWKHFGASVSMNSDGSVIAIGEMSSYGKVYVYDQNGESWTLRGTYLSGPNNGNSRFGCAVSLNSNGTILAVGNHEDKVGATNGNGRVSIFQWASDAWQQVGEDITGEAASDRFGEVVSISDDGTIVAIGASENDGTGEDAGHVRVYQLTDGAWVQMGQDIDGEAAQDKSGTSLSLSADGTTVAIGAPRNKDGANPDSGHARVYEYNSSTSQWVQKGGDIDGTSIVEYLGQSVSLDADGNILAVGIPYKETAAGGTAAGQVQVYEYSDGNWVQKGANIDGNIYSNSLGVSVSLSDNGNIVAAGASDPENAGRVRVFKYNNGSWSIMGSPVTGKSNGDNYGTNLALSADGSRFVAGSEDYNMQMGFVNVFNFTAPANSLPEFTSTPTTEITENQQYTYSITATDGDEDDLTITLTTGVSWLSLNDNGDGTAVLSGMPANADIGNHEITLTIDDGTDQVTQTFTITVVEIPNSLPTFTSSPVTNATEDQQYSYSVTTNDPDEDNLTISLTTDASWLSLTDNGDGTATLSGTPTNADIGDHEVTLTVSDGTGQTIQQFTITVTEKPNTAPEFTSTAVTTATEDQVYSYSIMATDTDEDNLTITLTTSATWLSITDNGDGTATLSGTPASTDIGNHEITLTVDDGTDQATQTFTITVSEEPNTAPEFTSTATTTATQDQTYSYSITATDTEEDNLTITLTTSATWLSITDNGDGTATLSGTPASTDVGTHEITLTVSDGTDQVTQTFTITVESTTAVVDLDSENSIEFYPNPSKGTVNIRGNNLMDSQLIVSDLSGKTIINKQITTIGSKVTIDNKGIYIFRIVNKSSESIKKIVIE